MTYGYYKEKEIQYKRGTSGKINWSRTIKQIRPLISNDNAYYIEFITRKTNHKQDDLLSKIHRYCVYECFEKLGFIFSSYMPPKPELKLNKNLFNIVLKSKASNTFNESNLILFKNMLNVINYVENNNETKNYIYGTNNFHVIWEALIDEVYGEDDKTNYYPNIYWKLKNSDINISNIQKKNSLRPDTIMITNHGQDNQKIYVLDSKYYQYGYTKNIYIFPVSSTIVKPISSAHFIYNQLTSSNISIQPKINSTISSYTIFSSFIIPFGIAHV